MAGEFSETHSTENPELHSVQFDITDLVTTLKNVPEMFFQFLMMELLTLTVPAFHVDIFNRIINFTADKFALAVPRGHAKTTIVKLAVVWYFLFSPIRFIVYCSNTTPVAKDECRDIIEFMEGENFRAVFGAIKWKKRNESEGLYIFSLGDKTCILRALGAGQQVRGLNIDNQRPELLICDDAEDDENSSTIEQRIKLRRWVYGPLFKACARHSKKIWIGNLISSHCLIHEFCESPHWASIKYGCILEDGTPLWPEMFSIEYLKKDFLEYSSAGMAAKWFAEMMNMPLPEGMGLIKSDEIVYGDPVTPGDLQFSFITIDPAISQRTAADNSAIVVHGLVEGVWQVVDYFLGKVGPLDLFREAIRLAKYWHCRVIGIESIAYQAALQPIFQFLLAMEGEFGIEVVQLHAAGTRKTERIVAWAGWLKGVNYKLSSGDYKITTQLLTYDITKRDNDDDLIDACAYGPQMIAEHLNLILYNPNTAQNAVVQNEYEICSL